MAKASQSQALASLDTIYRFPGGLRSPGEVDIERPVSVVHDISQAAGREAICVIDGSFLVVTGGAGAAGFSVRTESQIRALAATKLRDLGLTPSNSWVWLLEYRAKVTAASTGNLARISAGIIPPNRGRYQYGEQPLLVAYGNTENTNTVTVAGGEGEVILRDSAGVESNVTHWGVPLPLRIREFQAKTLDGGVAAVTVRHQPIYAIAPYGVIPSL